jgi:ACT domain-containing protein
MERFNIVLLSAEEENEEVAHEGESKSAEALEADKDDSRQHLNVVFIGHVGKNLQRVTYDLFAHADCSGWMAVHLNSTE